MRGERGEGSSGREEGLKEPAWAEERLQGRGCGMSLNFMLGGTRWEGRRVAELGLK